MRKMAYAQSQAITLQGERAFEELYSRLARWTYEAAQSAAGQGDWSAIEAALERCVSVLGFMGRSIDLGRNSEVGIAVLSLHRFAIGVLVKAKAEHKAAELEGLPQVFISLGEIFAAIRQGKTPHTGPAAA